MLPPLLERERTLLAAQFEIEVVEEEAVINLILTGFPTGPLYSQPTTLLLLRVPRAYPDAGPDMFWTETSLILATGVVPQNGDVIEQYAGRSWRRFSWHHNGWNPRLQPLAAYLDFVRKRFDAP